eukprot:gene1047-3914_t
MRAVTSLLMDVFNSKSVKLADNTRVRLYLPGLGGGLAPDEDEIKQGKGSSFGGELAPDEEEIKQGKRSSLGDGLAPGKDKIKQGKGSSESSRKNRRKLARMAATTLVEEVPENTEFLYPQILGLVDEMDDYYDADDDLTEGSRSEQERNSNSSQGHGQGGSGDGTSSTVKRSLRKVVVKEPPKEHVPVWKRTLLQAAMGGRPPLKELDAAILSGQAARAGTSTSYHQISVPVPPSAARDIGKGPVASMRGSTRGTAGGSSIGADHSQGRLSREEELVSELYSSSAGISPRPTSHWHSHPDLHSELHARTASLDPPGASRSVSLDMETHVRPHSPGGGPWTSPQGRNGVLITSGRRKKLMTGPSGPAVQMLTGGGTARHQGGGGALPSSVTTLLYSTRASVVGGDHHPH